MQYHILWDDRSRQARVYRAPDNVAPELLDPLSAQAIIGDMRTYALTQVTGEVPVIPPGREAHPAYTDERRRT